MTSSSPYLRLSLYLPSYTSDQTVIVSARSPVELFFSLQSHRSAP